MHPPRAVLKPAANLRGRRRLIDRRLWWERCRYEGVDGFSADRRHAGPASGVPLDHSSGGLVVKLVSYASRLFKK